MSTIITPKTMIKDTITLTGEKLNSFDTKIPTNNIAARSEQLGKFPQGMLFERCQDGYGNSILKPVNSNTVVLGGALLALQRLTGVTPKFMPPVLNDKYNIPNNPGTGAETICLFGCGIGGSGLDFGNVKATDIKAADLIDNMVPMRCGADLTGDDAAKYYFKRDNQDGTYYWYLKEFDAGSAISALWKNGIDAESDGTEITSDVSNSLNTDGIETFVEFNISLNTSDVREYFEAEGNLSQARYNSFGFFTGEKVGDEYSNVRLFSYVNFNNRDVSVKTKSAFVYRIYSLI